MSERREEIKIRTEGRWRRQEDAALWSGIERGRMGQSSELEGGEGKVSL